MLHSTSLLGIKITTSIKKDIILFVQKYLQQENVNHFLSIFSINPEIVIESQTNKAFQEILNTSSINLPDGTGVVWGLKKFEIRNSKFEIKRISGIDFMQDLISLAASQNYPVAFIGGKNGVAQKAFENLQKKNLKLTGWAEETPEIKLSILDSRLKILEKKEIYKNPESMQNIEEYFKQLAQRITDSGVKLVFVGLGAPKQEMFINYLESLPRRQAGRIHPPTGGPESPLIFMSIGGAFDIISGKLKRAPKLFQQLNLEWLWRLIQEPWRFVRQLKLLKFVFLVFKTRFMVE